MSSPLVTINLVVFNGEKYLRYCLDAVKKQTYPHIEVNILNNASTDQSKAIVENFVSKTTNYKLWAINSNLGMWPGQEWLLQHSHGQYVVALSVDVLLHPEFIAKAVAIAEKDPTIGAIQSKTLQYALPNLTTSQVVRLSNFIDTLGFRIERSRRVVNIAHGEEDRGQYNQAMEIFGVEGAAPFLRRTALEDCRINAPPTGKAGKIIDEDMFWYGDDLDLAWRLRLFGWKQLYSPQVIAYHDRSTTKGLSHDWKDYLARIKIRRQIPIFKRRLDWRNKRIARLKNDYWLNVWHDLPRILYRESLELGYMLFFEPLCLLEIPKFITLIPRTLRKRKAVLSRAKTSPQEMQKWFK